MPPASSPAYAGVVFDLDGTLYRQSPLRRRMLVELATSPLRSGPLEAVRSMRILKVFRQVREELRELGHPAVSLAELQYRTPAERLGADAEVWKFLTGPEEELYPLLQEGYLLTALPSDTAAGGFFHSDQVLLIDADGRIRGTYDGTRTSEVDQMLEDLMSLMARTRPVDQP